MNAELDRVLAKIEDRKRKRKAPLIEQALDLLELCASVEHYNLQVLVNQKLLEIEKRRPAGIA